MSERASELQFVHSFAAETINLPFLPSLLRPFLRSVRSAQGKGSNAESVLNYCRSLRIIVAVFATLFYEVCPRLVRVRTRYTASCLYCAARAIKAIFSLAAEGSHYEVFPRKKRRSEI